jgi:hypothetical protein
MIPNKEGWYLWSTKDETYEVEVYEGPNGSLCVWCDDVGAGGYEPIGTTTDNMNGHMLTSMMGGEWTYLRPFDK